MDTIRDGKAPEVVRRKGAEGLLPVGPREKIEILVLLAEDQDEAIRKTVSRTLETYDVTEFSEVLADPATPNQVLDFAAQRLLPTRHELAPALLANPVLLSDVRIMVENHLSQFAGQENASPPEPEAGEPREAETEGRRETLLQRISRMTVAEKIKKALTGTQDERMILVREANKVVARAVLESPKLSDREIENIASMKSVTEEILRLVAANRRFRKSYTVVRALLENPRTPIDVGLPLLNRMNDRDLKGLSINKNVAEVLRSMATKMIKQKEYAKKVKMPGHH